MVDLKKLSLAMPNRHCLDLKNNYKAGLHVILWDKKFPTVMMHITVLYDTCNLPSQVGLRGICLPKLTKA